MRIARSVTALVLIVSPVAVTLTPQPLAAAMPPLGHQTSDCRTSTVQIRVKGVLVDYDCFGADTGLAAMHGAQVWLSPSGERSANGYSSTGGINIYISSAAGCRIHSGLTLSLKNRCLLLSEDVNFSAAPIMSQRNICNFRAGKSILPLIPCVVPADRTSGSITFTHWSTSQGARISFRFSPGATLTGVVPDTSAANGMRTIAVPISGSATTTPVV